MARRAARRRREPKARGGLALVERPAPVDPWVGVRVQVKGWLDVRGVPAWMRKLLEELIVTCRNGDG